MRDYVNEGVCPDCEDPSGFDTCSECGEQADGLYCDDGYEEKFLCNACCMREAERDWTDRWDVAPVPEFDEEMPF